MVLVRNNYFLSILAFGLIYEVQGGQSSRSAIQGSALEKCANTFTSGSQGDVVASSTSIGGERRRFSSVQKKEGWRLLQLSGMLGDLYWNPEKPEILVKKYKGNKMEDFARASARIHTSASDMIEMNPSLSSKIDILPTIEVGRDFVTKPYFKNGIRLESLSELSPGDQQEALSLLDESRRALMGCCDIGQDLLKEVLLQTLTFGSEHVFWNPRKRKLTIPDLVMTEGQLDASSALPTLQAVGTGQLMISHRPKLKNIINLQRAGFTHVVTLLGEAEGAVEIGKKVENSGMKWIWFPLGSAKVPDDVSLNERILKFISELSLVFRSGSHNRVYLHCSAGLHRSGMITYALLRYLGYSAADSIDLLTSLRPVVAIEIGHDRLDWANNLIDQR